MISLAPRIRLWFDGQVVNSTVVRYETHSAFGKHSVNVLDLAAGVASPYPEWTPVMVDLTNGAESDRWYGYVHHSGSVDDSRGGSMAPGVTRYTLVGTSLPLNTQRNRSWHNVTRSSIARDVARNHGLRSIVEHDRELLSYEAQAGESDLALMQRLSADSGYRLWVDGSTLLYVDPETLLSGVRRPDIRVYQKAPYGGRRDVLIKWVSKSGHMIPRAGGVGGAHAAYGLDDRTHRVIGAERGPGVLQRFITNKALSGAAQTMSAVRGREKSTQGWVTAKATVTFSPTMKPGNVIEISGKGSNEADRGLWLVTAVSHRVLRDGSARNFEHVTTLDLERNTQTEPQFATAFRTINTRDLVSATIRSGAIWEASIMEDIRVGKP